MNPTVGAIPWYKSPVYIALAASLLSGLAMLFPKIALQLGLGSPDAIQKSAELVLGWVGVGVSGVTVVASALGMIKRGNSVIQPLTLTQKGADAHPATVAVLSTAGASAAPAAADATQPIAPGPTPGA